MEEVEFEIFRLTTFSTNGDIDEKEGRKEYEFFRPKGVKLDLYVPFVRGTRTDVLIECGGL